MIPKGGWKMDRRRRISGIWRFDSTMERPGHTPVGRAGAWNHQTPSFSVHAAIPPVLDGIVASVS